MSDQKTDILIIGGGIAGCIAAISLVDTYHVTIIDKLEEPKARIGESLAPAADRILKELDLLDGLTSSSTPIFQPNLGMQSYWGSEQVQIVDHLRNPDGFVKSLDRRAFEVCLRNSAESRGARCLWGTTLYASEQEGENWNVKVRSGHDALFINISASFVIDASGRQAHFARQLGVEREVEDKLMACWVSLPNTLENTMSTICSEENGWWYSAVVPNNKRVIAYHSDSDLIDRNEFRTKGSFLKLAQKNHHISQLLTDDVDNIVFHGTVSANSTKLECTTGSGWIALGDAAISFDPLSSQGMFNAMASAMQLRDLVRQHGFSEQTYLTYENQVNQIWLHYLKHKQLFYQSEMRFQMAEFWRRRS